MVFLTMNVPIVEALKQLQSLHDPSNAQEHLGQDSIQNAQASELDLGDRVQVADHENTLQISTEPALADPKYGNPISHGKIIEIARRLKTHRLEPNSLEVLLKGAKIYVAPPPPKAEPTSEYKALMARLRREEEARSYERMINPPTASETFNQRFPTSSAAHAFSAQQNIRTSDPDDDGLTFADVDRQMALILNVLLSIVACAGAIWVAARWWSTPARLALSMSGSMLVGVAEVVVYSGYIRRVGEAKVKERSVKEVKEVTKTWIVGAGQDKDIEDDHEKSVNIESSTAGNEITARQRRKNGI